MTAPRSVTSSDVFEAQKILEPLYNIACHHLRTDAPAQTKLQRFFSRFMVLAYLIKSGPRREATLNDNLLQLLESCCEAKEYSDAAFQRNHYPSLNLLATIWSARWPRCLNEHQRLGFALNKVNVHWGTPRHQEHLLTELDNYSQEGEMGLNTGRTTKWNDTPEGDQLRLPHFKAKDHASSIFHALDACRKACSCNPAHDYCVRLALETHTHRGMLSSPKFMLHIMTNSGSSTWKEASVENEIPSEENVFPDSMLSRIKEIFETLRKDYLDTEFKPTERLCDLLKELDPEQIQLQLRVVKDNLLFKRGYMPGKYSASKLGASTSLQTLIEGRGNLGERLELIIGIKLAHAALHLEKGPWMKAAWNKQSIQFLNTSDLHIPPEPFFFTRISPERIPGQGHQSELFHHPDIGLLALGIMLLELRLGRTIESLTASNRGVEGRNPLIVAKKVYNDFKNGFPEDFRLAIEACLDIRFGGPLSSRVDEEEFAKRIHKRIIAPLEREFADLCRVNLSSKHFEDALQDVRLNVLEKPPMALKRTSSPNSGSNPTSRRTPCNEATVSALVGFHTDSTHDSAGPHNYGNKTLRFFHDTTPGSQFTEQQCLYADNFLQRQQKVYEERIAKVEDEVKALQKEDKSKDREQTLGSLKFPQRGYRIRVAVLDTGIHLKHNFIPPDRIKDIRTWIDGADGRLTKGGGDENGHGTHVAHLILKVAPDSDLYVAQIAQHSVPENSLQISKAIMYAVKEWKVDIITMSFGMSREDKFGRDELRDALNTANSAGVLLFAAASNEGGNMHRAFPARHPLVFCIHGTDGMGNPCTYNPTPERNQLNLATLGDAIKSAWPYVKASDPRFARKSGTSFSTPIAAAFAAVVLLYVRQRLPDKAAVFKWHDKMREVFEKTSSTQERGGYNYFSLEMLLGRDHQHIESDLIQIADR